MENLIVKFVLKKIECEAIILFGSYARGMQNFNSDINIAIKPKHKIENKMLYELSIMLQEKIEKDIDLVNLDEIEETFRYEILVNGKILYCEDEVKFDFYKLDMYREFLDLNESRNAIIDNIKKGESIYGK